MARLYTWPRSRNASREVRHSGGGHEWAKWCRSETPLGMFHREMIVDRATQRERERRRELRRLRTHPDEG